MKRRSVFISILGIGCLIMIAILQRQELLRLCDEQQRLLAQSAGSSDISMQALSTESATVSPELLRLRNQVNLITHRRQELAGLRSENERLRLQLAERSTNAALALPPGYLRKSQARLVGFNTPEDTLQSFLWALQNRDATNALHALTPETAEWFQSQAQRSGSFEKLFERSEAFIGFSIVNTQRYDDGTFQANLELVPGLPPIAVNLHQIGNEWKITSLP